MTNTPDVFHLCPHEIDTTALGRTLSGPGIGAVVTFEGRVRDHNAGRIVHKLEYRAYEALALKTGARIVREEGARHGALAAVAAHRTGLLEIGETAVWAGVGAAHRKAAFHTAQAIVERLKFELPVWKREWYQDGEAAWVGPDNSPPDQLAKPSATTTPPEEVAEWPARLHAIYLSPGHDFRGRHGKGRLDHGMVAVAEAECVAGLGLRGDRYFGHKPDYKGQVTFFDLAVVEAVRQRFNHPALDASWFRRNLLVEGVDLGEWIGKRFRFQGIEFEGAEECRPCYWMDEAVAPGVEEFLKENCGGGLRARIIHTGILRTDANG